MDNSTTDTAWRQLAGFGKKFLFVGGFALTPIAMGGLVQDVDSWGGVYGWLVRAWDDGFRQPVSALLNLLLAWSSIEVSGPFVDYVTIGGIVVAAYHRTTLAFPLFAERVRFAWTKSEMPLYIRWPLGIAIWPATVAMLYMALGFGVMALFISWPEQVDADEARRGIIKIVAAASAFLLALLLPFILKALDAQGAG
jgi:hypothetical protein